MRSSAVSRHSFAGAWRALGIVVAIAALMPVLVLAISWLSDASSVWEHLAKTLLPELVRNTLFLMVGVGLMVSFLGVGLALLVARYDFPARGFFEWALLLPLAVPAYVLAFIALDFLDFAGILQSALRSWGLPVGFSARNGWVVVLVMGFVLYPYVYLLVKTALQAQGRTLIEAGRALGLRPPQVFRRVTLPLIRPAVVAGMSLALMETLADFGAVSIFNFDTFTTAIYKAWYSLFNLDAAAQLASLLLLFVLVVLAAEYASRGRQRTDQSTRNAAPVALRGYRKWLAFLACATVFAIAFVLPVGRLLTWFLAHGMGDVNGRFFEYVEFTLIIATAAAGIMVVVSVLLAWAARLLDDPLAHWTNRIATMGYAMPGSLLAVGVMLSFAQFDALIASTTGLGARSFLVGSLVALLLALSVRYLAVAFGPVENAFGRVRPSLLDAARSMGCNPRQVLWRVYLPLVLPGLLAGMVLALVDIMKEMPATLLLRPTGWDTLSVRIFELTSEGEWERAALPSLALVVVGLVPVMMLARPPVRSRRTARH